MNVATVRVLNVQQSGAVDHSSGRPPKVTLAMPVYNGENYIHEAIDSILKQTFDDFELIITDNASTDRTQAICESFAAEDNRIRYVSNARNLGASENYNVGFRLGRGEYLKWAAHDDHLSDNFLECCVEALDKHPDTAVAFARTICIDGQGVPISTVGEETPSLIDPDPGQRFYQAIVQSGTCFPIFGLFRRSLLEQSMLHQPYYGSDRALLAEMAILGNFRRIDAATFYNREHTTRSINIDDKLTRSIWQTGTASRKASAEHLMLARHLFRIAGRHREVASPLYLRRKLSRFLLKPVQLSRYGLESLALVSPRAARLLKTAVNGFRHDKSSNTQPDGEAQR